MAFDPVTGLPKNFRGGPTGAYSIPYKPRPFQTTAPAVTGGPSFGGPTVGTVATALPERVDLPKLPNFKDMLMSDPLFLQNQANFAAESVSDRAGLSALRRRALAQFGEIPDFAAAQGELGLVGDVMTDVDEPTRQAARDLTGSGLSTVARIRQANEDALRNVVNDVTGRGLFSSGETGFQLGRQGRAFNQAQYDARQALIDFLAGAQQSFSKNERMRQQSLLDSLYQMLNNWPQGWPTPTQPPEPTPPEPEPVLPPEFLTGRGGGNLRAL